MDIASVLAVSAVDVPFSLSVLTATRGNASKALIAGAHGLPIKGTSDLGITRGQIEHVEVQGLAGLQTLLVGIGKNQALVHGIILGSRPADVHPIVPKTQLEHAKPGQFTPDTRARSLDYIAFYVAAVVKPPCVCFSSLHSLALCHMTPMGLAASCGVGTHPSPTTFYPCGLSHPSPDSLCVLRRELEGLWEATPSIRRLASHARQINGPPPPGPRSRSDSTPQ